MAKLVVMPKLGLTMTEGAVSRWLKKEGEPVQEGEPLFEVETDKLTNTIEATASGTLLKILAKEGDTLPCLAGVAVIGAPGEDISGLIPGAEPKAEAPSAPGRRPRLRRPRLPAAGSWRLRRRRSWRKSWAWTSPSSPAPAPAAA